jgi:serine/threonine-protein kinase
LAFSDHSGYDDRDFLLEGARAMTPRQTPEHTPSASVTQPTSATPESPSSIVNRTVMQPADNRTQAMGGEIGPSDFDRTLRQDVLSGATDAQQVSSGTPAATGSRYRILSLHARGGLGVVYVAEDTELRRRVALKEIQVHQANDGRSRHRFILEAEITGRLAHPGIVPVHGLGQHEDGRPFYAMRFVEGETLLDAIQRYHRGDPADRGSRRLALRQLLKHFVDVCNAVAYAHNQGVIHRDLKPSNVLLGKFGETLLVDWGLAKYLGVCQADSTVLSDDPRPGDSPAPIPGDWTLPTESGTQMGSAIGTPAYMSPEQAAGRWDDVGISSDIYSLGASLYTILAGVPPLPKSSDPGEWVKVAQGGIAAPRILAPETSAGLTTICRKAMSPLPSDRYAGALDLAADIEHWLGDEPINAMPESAVARMGRWARRHLAFVSGVSAAVLVLGVSLTVGVGLLANANRQIMQVNSQLRDANAQLVNANEQIRTANRLTLKAVDDFFTDVSENPRLLRKEPGTQELRRVLLERARSYYEGFLRERSDDATVQIETASAYFRLAAIQEMLEPGAKALDSYRRSEVIRAGLVAAAPADATRIFDLAVSRNHIGKLLHDLGKSEEALKSFLAARDSLVNLAAAHSEEPKYAKELARVLANIGVALHIRGRSADALDAVTRARGILEQLVQENPADADIAKEYSTTLGTLGALQRLGGKAADAVTTLTSASTTLELLMRKNPDRPEFAQDLAQTTNLLAIALSETNRRAEALTAYERSRETREKLVRENPAVADYIQELGLTYNNIATVLRVLDRPEDAIESCRKALELQRKLVAEHPELFDYKQDLARTHNNLGILHADQFRREGALAEYMEAKVIQEKLAKSQPQNTELARELAKCCHNLGRLYVDLARLDDARMALEQARGIRDKLAAEQGSVPTHGMELADSLLALSDLSRQQGRFLEALQEADRALAASDNLPAPLATPIRCSAWRAKALTMSRVKRHTESLAAWDESLKHADASTTPYLQLGRAAAQMRSGDVSSLEIAEAAIVDANAPAATVIEAARVYALGPTTAHHAVAIGLLRRAATAGWFRDPVKISALQNDADFAALREQGEFKQWVSGLRSK